MRFYELLGLKEIRRIENDKGRFTLVFMAPEGQAEAPVELTYNWDGDEGLPSDSRHFGHLAYEVEDIYAMCERLQAAGVTINRPPRDGHMAFVRSPGQRVDRAVADGRVAGAGGAVEEHGKHRALVSGGGARRWRWRSARRRRRRGGVPAGAVARARRLLVGRRARVPAADGGAGGGADGAGGDGGVPGGAGAAGDAAGLRVVGLAAAAGAAGLGDDRGRGRPRRGGGAAAAAGGGASSSTRRRSASRCSSAGGRWRERTDCARRTLDVSGDGTNNDGVSPEMARRDFPLEGVTVNGLVVGATVVTLVALLPAVRDPGAGGLRRGGGRLRRLRADDEAQAPARARGRSRSAGGE